uniref:RNA binding motif protein 43 n=2 Tax=Varanus komodoensis TaxID=61221 RepID=A0A8D2LQD4_VARKO
MASWLNSHFEHPLPERTVVVCGVPGSLDHGTMVDILKIHFQKTKNNGGDVEDVDYPTSTKGVAYVTFEDKQVAEKVLTKSDHKLEDKRFRRDYPLKVSLYGESIFTCVTCILSLSIFGEQHNLEDLVQDLKKNLPCLSFGPLHPSGKIRVQGPFSAISLLKDRLLLKMKPTLPEQQVKGGEGSTAHSSTERPMSSELPLAPRDNLAQSTSKEAVQVTLDTDVYYYFKTFVDPLYKTHLERCGVMVLENVDGELTTICFREDNKPGSKKLEDAKHFIETWSANLHGFLRKERLVQEGFTQTGIQNLERACEIVRPSYPRVLVIPYQTHIDVIGSSSDIYMFSQQVNELVRCFPKQPWR